MLRTIKGQLQISIPSIFGSFILVLGGGIFGTVLFELIMRLDEVNDEAPTTFEMSFLMGLLTIAIIIFVYAMKGAEREFNNTIGMGRTRKGFIIGHFIVSLLTNLLCILALEIIYVCEQLRLDAWWSQYPCETHFSTTFSLPLLFFLAVVLSMVQEYMGFLIIRFGKKAFWGIWALWMFCCTGIPRIVEDMDQGKNSIFASMGHGFLNIIHSVPLTIWYLIVFAVSVLLLFITYLGYSRQHVTS